MFGLDVAQRLQDEGYNEQRASETGQSRADDEQILRRAISDNRILIKLDEHFGDWVILPLSRHPGVIRVKVNPTTSENVLRNLLAFLSLHAQEKFKDYLVILSPKSARWIHTA
jgi:predicted nuclease of predicted toxin-antitoxin system